MNYIEFTETVCDKVRELYQNEDCTVEVQHTLKNNAVSLCALVIRYTGEEAAPAIYLEQYYDMYKDGTSVEDIVKDIVEEFKEAMEGYDIILPDLTDFDSVKDSIVCRLINTESNSKMLEDVPHKEFLDLSIVFMALLKIPGVQWDRSLFQTILLNCGARMLNHCIALQLITRTECIRYAYRICVISLWNIYRWIRMHYRTASLT